MILLIHLMRAVLILVLALVTLSLVVGVATPTTGLVEKVVLLALIAGCVYLAASVPALAGWMANRSARP